MKISALPNFSHYITFIVKPHEFKPTVYYYLNNEYTDVIQQGNFLFLPIHKNQSNNIEISTEFKKYDNNWEAIPIGVYTMMNHCQERSFITNVKNPFWLTSICGVEFIKGKCERQISIKLDRIKESSNEFYENNVQYMAVGKEKKTLIENYELGTPLLTYENNSWTVGYKLPKPSKSDKKKIKFRSHKTFHVNCSTILNTNNIFNYVVIGNKTIPIDQIYFIKKVHTIHDWINSFYSMLTLSIHTL